MNGAQFLDCGGKGLRVGLCSRGLTKIAALPTFLGLTEAKFGYAFAANYKNFDLFVGWGRKPSGQTALRFATKSNKHFLLLEDGFLRSVFPASVVQAPPLSIVTDQLGIYYDSTEPSQLETHIADSVSAQTDVHVQGEEILRTLREKQLCKYNNFQPIRDAYWHEQNAEERVLVIDQTAGDLSVSGAGASDDDFGLMLEAALDENPHAQILIKSHPETSAGKRRGYLSHGADNPRCKLITDPINSWDLLAQVSSVYVVSSQLGFDALAARKSVRCFGLPFYAGWGLSKDEKACARRAHVRPTIEQIAYAAYGKYCRYLDPYSGTLTDFSTTAATLEHLSQVAQKSADLGPFLGIFPWNQKTVRAMFQLYRPQHQFTRSAKKAIQLSNGGEDPISAWSSRLKPETETYCAENEIPLFRLEDGFVRSVGLGSNFHQPMSLVLDRTGIYYNSSKPSDLEILLNSYDFDDELLSRAASIIEWLRIQNISKYNLSQNDQIADLPQNRTKILVPGQVEDDASVLNSGSSKKSSVELLQAVRAANPDSLIVFKPHPDVVSGQRPGLLTNNVEAGLVDCFVENVSILSAISVCDEVHTLTSLSGFEALIRKKPVTCYGLPFYAGWGLTEDKLHCERRTRKLSLEALVAASLILYPNYVDPVSNLPCTPEIVMKRIGEARQSNKPIPSLVKARMLLGQARKLRRRILNR